MSRKGKNQYLYDYRTNKYGYKIFDKKPSSFTDAEIQKAVKLINDRIYKLEKSGNALDSRFYQNLMDYAEKEQAKVKEAQKIAEEKGTVSNIKTLFNVSDDGRIRITSDLGRLSGDTSKEKYENIKRIQGYLSSQTSTVSGTNKAIKKAYETFISNPSVSIMSKKVPTLDEYRNLWKTYRENVSKDKKELLGSDVVIQAIKKIAFYDLPQDQLERAFQYTEQVDSIRKNTGLKQLFELWKEGKLITGEL